MVRVTPPATRFINRCCGVVRAVAVARQQERADGRIAPAPRAEKEESSASQPACQYQMGV